MIKLLTIENELRSAQKLDFETFLWEMNPVEKFQEDVIIRWGNGGYCLNKVGHNSDFKNVINSVEAIKLNCNKDKALKKLSEVVDTPKIFTESVPDKQQVVYRP